MLTTTPTVDAIARAAVATVDQLLRATGEVRPPTMHILCEDMDQPYVGYLTCRPFRRGADAEAAIAEMGSLASAVTATRLVVTWEHQDLMVALDRPGDHPNAVVIVDADLSGEYTLTWNPFTIDFGRCGVATAVEWGESACFPDASLPEPLIVLLTVWRKTAPPDLESTVVQLETAGHRMRWPQQ
jgi:hypothetical protein